MDRIELQKLRELPIEGVAERLGLQVSRHKALCPFHDDHHASLSFKKNKYKCWSCGASGDTISLVMRYLNKPFLDACRWLGAPLSFPRLGGSPVVSANQEASPSRGRWEGARYARFFEHPWLIDEAQRFLFEERRLDPRVVRWCRLTSWRDRQGIPWLQTPYYDRDGKLIGIQNRNLTPLQLPRGGEKEASPRGGLEGVAPRFRFPSGSECSIYNLPMLRLLRPGDELYINEGCSDCWAMLSAGHKAIAIPSATLLKPKDVELLKKIAALSSSEGDKKASPRGGLEGVTFHMFPDRDTPGEHLFLQLQEVLPSLVRHQLPPDCKDYSEYYLKMKK